MRADTLIFILAHYFAISILAILSCAVGWRITKGLNYHSFTEKIAICTGLGLGVIASFIFALGLMQLLYPAIVLAALVLFTVLCSPTLKELEREFVESFQFSKTHFLAGSAFLLLLLSISTLPLYPPLFTDATGYHLALAKISLQSHQVAMTPFLRYPVFPRLNEMLFSLSLILYDDVLAQLVQFLMMLLVAVALIAWGRQSFSAHAGLVAAALWQATPLVLWLGASAGVDIGLTLFVTLSVCSFSNWMSSKSTIWLILSGVFIGFAAGSKYSALIFLGILGIATLNSAMRDRNWTYPAIFGMIAVCVAAPWYLFNLYYAGNPVFPFFGEIFGYGIWSLEDLRGQMSELAHWGTGRTLESFLLLPWNLVFNQGKFHLTEAPMLPFYILALPFTLVLSIKIATLRGLVVLSVCYLVYWFFSAQILRYLVPILPLLCLATAVLFERGVQALPFLREKRIHASITILAVVALSLNGSLYVNMQTGNQGPLPVNRAERDSFYSSKWIGYDAYKFLNSQRGEDYTVYAVGESYMAYFADGKFEGDAFGPARYIRITQLADGQSHYRELKALNATHFLQDFRETNLNFPKYVLPDDDFFHQYFRLVFTRPYIRLYEIVDQPMRRYLGPQLLQNPGFEDLDDNQPIAWTRVGTPLVSSQSHSGSKAVQSTGVLDAYYQVIPVQSEGFYLLGEFARAQDPKQKLRLQIDWWDAQKKLVRTDLEIAVAAPNWKYYETTVAPPENAAFAAIYSSAEGQNVVWLDDLSFAQVKYESE